MSVFSAEITMQICVAPAAIMRSTRYSETALGRSAPFTMREPTGSSSFEQPSGCMRSPAPAAGMIPIIVRPLSALVHARRSAPLQDKQVTAARAPCRYAHPACAAGPGQPWLPDLLPAGPALSLHLPRCAPPEARFADQKMSPALPSHL